jgi:predicted nucleic acid-binding protein
MPARAGGQCLHGIRRIYTRDTDFHRFPVLEPVDPLA